MKKFQESFYTHVLSVIGVLHGIADPNGLKRALETTHPECNYIIEEAENKNDLILIVDCFDFQMKYLCLVNANGYIHEIQFI